MFDSICRDYGLDPTARLKSLSASIAVHAAVFGLMGVTPLLLIEGSPMEEPLVMLFNPVEMPAPVIQTAAGSFEKPAAGGAVTSSPAGKVAIPPDAWVEPGRIPVTIPPPSDDYFAAIGVLDWPGGPPAGPSEENTGGRIVRDWIGQESGPPPLPSPPELKKPIRVGSLAPSKLIHRVDPPYPILAKKMRIEGTVCLEAVIDEEGNVTDVTVMSGHATLSDAAVKAVRQWKYTPTVQNGEPVPILAIIRVVFKLR